MRDPGRLHAGDVPVEILVGPGKIVEIYETPVCEEQLVCEENLRARRERVLRRRALGYLLLGVVMGAAGMAALVCLLRGL